MLSSMDMFDTSDIELHPFIYNGWYAERDDTSSKSRSRSMNGLLGADGDSVDSCSETAEYITTHGAIRWKCK